MRWPSVDLASVADSIDYGYTASAITNPGGPKFLRITDIQDGQVDWDTVPFCVASPQQENASKLGPYPGRAGRAADREAGAWR
jgi:type I restriction enzyme S subunit